MKIHKLRKVRHKRLRKKVIGVKLKPRLCVFRSNKHIYAQVINDELGQTLVSASTLSKEFTTLAKKVTLPSDRKGQSKEASGSKQISSSMKEAAYLVGKLIAGKAKELGIKEVCFDRGGYKYHGKIKSLSEGAREGGLIF
jgi:large subunit ribosomal protein L18